MNPYRLIASIAIVVFVLVVQRVAVGQTQTLSTSFKIKHTSTARVFESRKFINTRDNATIIAGKWGASEDGADLLIMKVSTSGQVLWSKRTVVGIILDDYDLAEMSDGSIVFYGNSQYNPAPAHKEMLLIKFTCQGDVVWSRNLTMQASVDLRYLAPFSIKEGANNDIIVSFYGGGVNSSYAVINRINSLGNLVWSRTFYGFDIETSLLPVTFYSNNKLMVLGFKSKYTNFFRYNKEFFAMKLNYATGAIEDERGYNYSEFITNYAVLVTHPKIHFYAEQLNNGGFALFGVFSNGDFSTGYFYKLLLKPDLSIDRSVAFAIPRELSMGWAKIAVFPSGQTHIFSSVHDYQRFYWYACDSLEQKIREQKTVYFNTYIDLRYAVGPAGNNRSKYILSTQRTTGSATNGIIEIVQAEDNDPRILSCLGNDTTFVAVVPWQVNPGSLQWQSVKDNQLKITPLTFSSFPVTVTSMYNCQPVDTTTTTTGPSAIKIRGEDTVCNAGTSYQYVAGKVNQPAPVNWQLDAAQNGSVTTINDSTVSVTFTSPINQPRRVTLYASAGICPVTVDSVHIMVYPAYQKLSANVNACDLPFTLHAGPWFSSYLWQDGSTDSTYTVTTQGLYYVTLTDVCGNILRDSINVTPLSAIPLDIGVNRTKCNSDTIHLTASSGFASYTWGNNYNISSLTGQSVVVNPAVDTSYYVKAEIKPGCYIYDTVHIKVFTSPAVDIGGDTSFCSGDSVVLRATAGFSSYQWSNGGTNIQALTVKTAGTYTIVAVTPQGCGSYDTMRVLQVYPPPVVQLNKSSGLCAGEKRTLDAGAFTTYLWHDGSKGRTITAGNTGKYSVRVSDDKGCKGMDSVTITTIHPLPRYFLPADTTICHDDKTELRAVSAYRNYLWSTAATGSSIVVSGPGIYWLTVEDNNSCKGNDSITLTGKECQKGLYIPNAFTPNNDGKNDVFRPIVFGKPKHYEFIIYNRWGQVVFQSYKPGEGWDGKIAAAPQQTNVFAWICSYQFEGGKVITEKGAVTLIR